MPVESEFKVKQLSDAEIGTLICFGSPNCIGLVFKKDDLHDTTRVAVLSGPSEYVFRWIEIRDFETCFDLGKEWSFELSLTEDVGIGSAIKKDEPGFISVGKSRTVMNFLAPPDAPSSGPISINLSNGLPARAEDGSTSFGSWKLWPSSPSPERRYREPLASNAARTR